MQINGYKVIGIGAGGTNLVHYLGQYLNFHGQGSIVTLVDGDSFEDKNFQNQRFRNIGNKAQVKKEELRQEFNNVRFRAIPHYVTEENVSDMIEDSDIVFLGVDNHKTRSLVNAHCQTLDNVVLINGGLENYDGDVIVYIRQDGKDITPNLAHRHPEIADPEDEAPYELSCDEVIGTEPARLITVISVADWMMVTFANFLEGRIDYCEIYIDTATTQVRKVPISKDFSQEAT